jgi:glyceraldehyde 3-phosphate dehydrogenase
MTVKVGFNGFGRIGKLTLRAINKYYKDDIEVVAVNNWSDPKTNAHLIKRDTVYGQYPGEVDYNENSVIVDGKKIRIFNVAKPEDVDWLDCGVDIVLECSGVYTDAKMSALLIEKGIKKVLISAPAKNEDIMLVYGINEHLYQPENHHLLSNASCTTNCVAPVARVLHDTFGIEKALMTTVHAVTSDQRLLDGRHSDLRRARAAMMNIIPTTTGAAKAVTRVIPELEGKIDGIAFRVAVPTVSVVDLVATLKKKVTVEDVNRSFKEAAEGSMSKIMEYCEEELVSTDFSGNPASAIIDAPGTMVIADNMVKVLAWYDNEWGYSCRMADLTKYISDQGL